MLTTPAAQTLVSKRLDSFLVVVTGNPNGGAIASPTDTEYTHRLNSLVAAVEARLARVPDELQDIEPAATGIVSDKQVVTDSISDQARKDLVTGEMIAMPAARPADVERVAATRSSPPA